MPVAGPKPTKPVVTPEAKMKNLHWKRYLLDPGADADKASIWWKLPEVPFDRAEFESKFAQKSAAKPRGEAIDAAGGAGGKGAASTKVVLLKALEPKRSNAIGIMMSTLPPPNAIKTAILSLDGDRLDREQLGMIRDVLPTAEELQAIADLDTPDAKWDKPELFAKTIGGIPRVRQRLECWAITRAFSEQAAAIDEPLKVLQQACEQVVASQALRDIFGMLLALGNWANGGTGRGQADGFPLSDIPKVIDMKDNTGKVTLLAYALKQWDATRASPEAPPPAALRLVEELGKLPEASKESLSELIAQQLKLASDVKKVKLAAENEPERQAHQAADPFKATMAAFAADAEAKVEALAAQVKTTEAAFAKLRAHFAAPKSTKDGELLPMWLSFLNEYKKQLPQPPKPKKPAMPKIDLAATRPKIDLAAGKKAPAAAAAAAAAGKRAKPLENFGAKIDGVGEGEDAMGSLIEDIQKGKKALAVAAARGKPGVLPLKEGLGESSEGGLMGGELSSLSSPRSTSFRISDRMSKAGASSRLSRAGGGGDGSSSPRERSRNSTALVIAEDEEADMSLTKGATTRSFFRKGPSRERNNSSIFAPTPRSARAAIQERQRERRNSATRRVSMQQEALPSARYSHGPLASARGRTSHAETLAKAEVGANENKFETARL